MEPLTTGESMARRQAGRLGATVIASVAVSLVALVLLPSVAGTTTLIRDTAPYTGAAPIARHSPAQNGTCATAQSMLVGHLRASTASGDFLTGSSACASGPAPWWYPNYPTISTSVGFLGPAFTLTSGGTRQVAYQWEITWNASGTGTGSGRPAVNISLFGNLYDKTTGTWVLGGSSAQNEWVSVFYASGPFSSGAAAQKVTVSFDASLMKGDRYQFYTVLRTSVVAYAATNCYDSKCHVGHASALLNINSGGDYAAVLSMSVT